ncbi:MAG: PAS domain-containing protein [Gammaproteobacteria bacterium]|nr:PAS domain-containing protein [Gammaproteobacteria bacterium]
MSEFSAPALPIDVDLFNQLSTGVILSDEQGNIVWVNDHFLELMSADNNSVIGAPVSALLGNSATTNINEAGVCRYKTRNDRDQSLWLHCVHASVPDNSGVQFTLHILTDISEFEQRQHIRPLVSTGLDLNRLDQATGVLNRRAIIQDLGTEVSRTRRYGNPLSVIMLRCCVPGSVSSDTNDGMLQTMVSCMNEHLRWVDKLGALDRFEFLIILPESGLEAARQTWEKINNAIQEVTLRREQSHFDYSVAITEWMKNDQPETMLDRLNNQLSAPKVA